MATPTPASSSERATGRAGEPVAAGGAAVVQDGAGHDPRRRGRRRTGAQEWEDAAAVAELPELLRAPGDDRLGRPERPVAGTRSSRSAPLLSLHPLDRRGHPRGQPARQDRDDRRGRPHRAVRLEYGEPIDRHARSTSCSASAFLLTVHDRSLGPARLPPPARRRRRRSSARGPDHLLWAICDDIVDGYFPFATAWATRSTRSRTRSSARPDPDALERLFALKRELIEVRRPAAPSREVFNQLTNRETPLIDAEEVVYFRDVYDHLIRLTDELDNYRELAAATLDVYLTQVNNNLSVIMKRLTGVTVILAGHRRRRRDLRDERGRANARRPGTGFWLVTGAIVVAAAARGAGPAPDRLDLSARLRGVSRSDRAGLRVGVAWSARSTDSGIAMTWVLPGVPRSGPPRSGARAPRSSAASASSRSRWSRRTSTISYR